MGARKTQSRKKSSPLNGHAIKRGGGGDKGPSHKEKNLFLEPFFQMGGGGLGLNGPAIKRITFFLASITSITQDYFLG